MISERMTSRPYVDGDLDPIQPKDGIFSDKTEIGRRLRVIEGNPNAQLRTIILDERPIAILGVYREWSGVGTVFSVMDKAVADLPISFYKLVLAHLVGTARVLRLHRIHMTILAGRPELHRWATALGFRHEGLLKHYGPYGEDHCMYARYFNNG